MTSSLATREFYSACVGWNRDSSRQHGSRTYVTISSRRAAPAGGTGSGCVCGGGVVRVRVLERVRRMLRIAVQQWRIRIFMGHIIIRTH